MAENCDPSVWSVTPASGQLGGPSTEEVTVRWSPKANAPPGETEVSVHSPAYTWLLLLLQSHAAATDKMWGLTSNSSAVCAWPGVTQPFNRLAKSKAAHLTCILRCCPQWSCE